MSPIVVIAGGLTVYFVTLLIVDMLRLWTFQREAHETLMRRWAAWELASVIERIERSKARLQRIADEAYADAERIRSRR